MQKYKGENQTRLEILKSIHNYNGKRSKCSANYVMRTVGLSHRGAKRHIEFLRGKNYITVDDGKGLHLTKRSEGIGFLNFQSELPDIDFFEPISSSELYGEKLSGVVASYKEAQSRPHVSSKGDVNLTRLVFDYMRESFNRGDKSVDMAEMEYFVVSAARNMGASYKKLTDMKSEIAEIYANMAFLGLHMLL